MSRDRIVAEVIDAAARSDRAAFDLNAFLHAANERYVLRHDRTDLDRARRSINAYLAAAGAPQTVA